MREPMPAFPTNRVMRDGEVYELVSDNEDLEELFRWEAAEDAADAEWEAELAADTEDVDGGP